MKTELIVPRLTYTMEFCTINEFLVENGAHVEDKQPIAHVTVDKADVEFLADRAGYIQWACEEEAELKPKDIYGYIADSPDELT